MELDMPNGTVQLSRMPVSIRPIKPLGIAYLILLGAEKIQSL